MKEGICVVPKEQLQSSEVNVDLRMIVCKDHSVLTLTKNDNLRTSFQIALNGLEQQILVGLPENRRARFFRDMVFLSNEGQRERVDMGIKTIKDTGLEKKLQRDSLFDGAFDPSTIKDLLNSRVRPGEGGMLYPIYEEIIQSSKESSALNGLRPKVLILLADHAAKMDKNRAEDVREHLSSMGKNEPLVVVLYTVRAHGMSWDPNQGVDAHKTWGDISNRLVLIPVFNNPERYMSGKGKTDISK